MNCMEYFISYIHAKLYIWQCKSLQTSPSFFFLPYCIYVVCFSILLNFYTRGGKLNLLINETSAINILYHIFFFLKVGVECSYCYVVCIPTRMHSVWASSCIKKYLHYIAVLLCIIAANWHITFDLRPILHLPCIVYLIM